MEDKNKQQDTQDKPKVDTKRDEELADKELDKVTGGSRPTDPPVSPQVKANKKA